MPSIIKVTDLTELTTPADGDFVPIVDISEALDIDKTKKISVLNLVVAKITAALAAYYPTLIVKRQGGSSTNWVTSGTTNYTPSASGVKIQCGVVDVVIGSGSDASNTLVNFPTVYTKYPLVFVSTNHTPATYCNIGVNIITTGGFYATAKDPSRSVTIPVFWLAIGE